MSMKMGDLSVLLPYLAAPLRTALSSLHLAAARLVPEETRESDPELDARAALLDQSYYRLARIVSSLNAAQYLAEQPLFLEEQDLAALVGDVFERVESLASRQGLDMKLICPVEHRFCAICADAMEQLLYHLLSNALKFTPRGGVITVGLLPSGEGTRLYVEDSGEGIPPQRLTALFEFAADWQRTGLPGQGLGLGLPLCQRIAQGHGGTLVAESEVGRGSRFTLFLPGRQTDRPPRARLSAMTFDYSGGFNRSLLGLADALPPEAFLLRSQS